MAKIKKVIENGGIQYPATITDAVKNPNNGKTVTEELTELGSQVIYDVSANNDGATFASLSALLSSKNLSTLIPIAVRCGGMSIRFAQTSDNKYIQARCMAQNFTTDVTQWQGVDDAPAVGSKNLVESGGVADDTSILNALCNTIISFNGNGAQESGTIKIKLLAGIKYEINLYCDSPTFTGTTDQEMMISIKFGGSTLKQVSKTYAGTVIDSTFYYTPASDGYLTYVVRIGSNDVVKVKSQEYDFENYKQNVFVLPTESAKINFNTESGEMEIPASSVFYNNNKIDVAAANIPYYSVAATSLLKIVYNTTNNNFAIVPHNVALTGDLILIGYIKKTYSSDKTDKTFQQAIGGFEYTVDGFSDGIYAQQTGNNTRSPMSQKATTDAMRFISPCYIVGVVNFNTSTGIMEIPAGSALCCNDIQYSFANGVNITYYNTYPSSFLKLLFNTSNSTFRIAQYNHNKTEYEVIVGYLIKYYSADKSDKRFRQAIGNFEYTIDGISDVSVINSVKNNTLISKYDDTDISSKAKSYTELFDALEGDCEPFIFFTDPHICNSGNQTINKDYLRNLLVPIQKYANRVPNSFVMCGGDWLLNNDYKTTACDKLAEVMQASRYLLPNFKPVIGNHDTNYQGKESADNPTGSGTLSQASLNALMFTQEKKAYYSFDGMSTKFYVLDSGTDWYDTMTTYRWEQVDWFANNLLNGSDENIAIAIHIYTNQTQGEEFPTAAAFAQTILDVAEAFNERTSITKNGNAYDYSSISRGHVKFLISGHAHYDAVGVSNGVPVIITTDATNYGTRLDFDLCLANYEAQKLHLIRVGNSGSDREVNLLY